jgi:hypothetical protein
VSIGGARRPMSASTPRANAVSVAIGIPHPPDPAPPARTAAKTRAGTSMPPAAANTGSIAARRVRSSPTASSRFTSSPITRKNRVMRPSFTTCRRSCSKVQPPICIRICVLHSSS